MTNEHLTEEEINAISAALGFKVTQIAVNPKAAMGRSVAFVRATDRKRLKPLESALLCEQMAQFNGSPVEIATKCGISPEYVAQLLTLARSPLSIREMVKQGETTAAVAIVAIRTHGANAASVLAAALQAARATGKTKVTTKFMPEQVRKVAMRKAAPKMFDAIQQVRANKAYAQLPPALQQRITELLVSVSPVATSDNAGAENAAQAPTTEPMRAPARPGKAPSQDNEAS
jgi:hypothetical protein